jgi:protein phosphatase 1L
MSSFFSSSLIRNHLAKLKLHFSKDVKHVPLLPDTRFPYSLIEVQGPWAMEDRACVHAKLGPDSATSLYGLFDGHNGTIAADYFSRQLPYLISKMPHHPVDLRLVFQQADAEFLALGPLVTQHTGSTGIIMLAREKSRKITLAHVGDSRAVLVRKDGSAMPLTTEHKPDRLDERLRIAQAGGTIEHWGVWRVDGTLAMSRSLGDQRLKPFVVAEPDVTEYEIDPKQDAFVVMGTDGLFDVLRNDDVASLCKGMSSCEQAASRLANAVVDRGIVDNTTILVVGCWGE